MNINNKPSNFRVPFVIDDRACCFWDVNIPETNMRFICNLDPLYFDYVAQINFSVLNDSNDERTKQHAAIALRTAYSQGLEALFALIAATLQAPDCVIGWVLHYKPRELENIVRNAEHFRKIKSKLRLGLTSWENISKLVFAGLDDNDENSRIRFSFAKLWSHFATDFLDDKFKAEYNSIKHGFRIHSGGYTFSIGPETKPDEEPDWSKFHVMGHSEFGSTYYIPERLESTPNYVMHQWSKNWDPERVFYSLLMISVSLQNLIIFLRKYNGDEEVLSYMTPNDEAFFDKSIMPGINTGGSGHKSRIAVKNIPLLTKEYISSLYEKSEGNA
jgi:hypothetical protein